MTYTPIVWAADHLQDIIAEAIWGARAVRKGLVRGVTDIKHSKAVTSLTGDIELGASVSHVTDAVWAARSNTLAFADGTLVPTQLMALEKFTMSDLRNSRFGDAMGSGARNLTSPTFEEAVRSYTLPRIAESYERRMFVGITTASKVAIAASSLTASQKAWAAAQTAGTVDGYVTRFLLAIIAGAVIPAAQTIVGVALTTANIVAQYALIYGGTPAEVASGTDCVIFAPPSDRALILQVASAQTKNSIDLFSVTGLGTAEERFSYLGVPIEFVQIQGKNAGAATGLPPRFMGRAGALGDFVWGTDLESDLNSAKVGPVNEWSTDVGLRMDATLDTLTLVPQQKTLYL